MSVPQITLSDADFRNTGLPWFGRPIAMDGEFATYLFGAAHENHPGWDYSENGRDAVPGGPITLYEPDFAGGWFDAACSAADLGASFTFAVLVKPRSTFAVPLTETFVSSYPDPVGGKSVNFGTIVASGVGYWALTLRDASDNPVEIASLPLHASTGSQYVLAIVVVQPALVTLYERGVGVTTGANTATGTAGLFGDLPFTIGDSAAHTVGGNERIAGAAFFNRMLSLSEVNTLYDRFKAKMAGVNQVV